MSTHPSEPDLEKLKADVSSLREEVSAFAKGHADYVDKLNVVEGLKKRYQMQWNKLKARLDQVEHNYNDEVTKRTRSHAKTSPKLIVTDDLELRHIKSILDRDGNYLVRIRDTLPRPPEIYLKIVLGQVPLCILDNMEKWKYKQDYEWFKLVVSLIIFVCSFVLLFVPSRALADSLFQLLLVWYYCTLTIRESILVTNGSRIKLWWRVHHFLATVQSSIFLIWPSSNSYEHVRSPMFMYCAYITFVQTLQFYYQKGLLYRLRALGETKPMDISLEGLHTWMLRGLGFLVPFLFIGYALQLYFAFWLVQLYLRPISDCCHEWHILASAILMSVFFVGNALTACVVLVTKFRQQTAEYSWMVSKYEGFVSTIRSFAEQMETDFVSNNRFTGLIGQRNEFGS